jgi:polyhydroxyalkanoate synthesis regulator phasin
MQEAWRAYLDLALGFTEASRKRAMKVAKKLVGRGGATADQLQAMAEDLVSTSMANRESLVRLVRFELDRALGRVGLATAEEVSQLTTRVRELEEELRVAHAGAAPAVPATIDDELAATTPPPAKVVRKAVVAKKAVAGAPATAAAPVKAAPTKAAPVKAEPAAKAAPAKAAPAKVTATAKAVPARVTVAQAQPAKATPATVVAKTAVAKKAVAKAPGKVAAKKAAPGKATGAGPAGTQS